MTESAFTQHEEDQIDYLQRQIRDQLALGRDLDDIFNAMKEDPFLSMIPSHILIEARRRHLRAVGETQEYIPLSTLQNNERKSGTWYTGPSDDGIFWPLVEKDLRKTIGDDATTLVDQASTKILQSLRPPGESEFTTRGLVVGYVQSGKTTSFISLISKAADAGYRLFIILAGMTDNLRIQTQQRVDEKLINPNSKRWWSLTSIDDDFSKTSKLVNDRNIEAIFNSPGQRIIAVVKKNGHILRSLNDFLGAQAKSTNGRITRDCPILIIDDEADQASVNVSTKAEQEASAINAQVRELLRNRKVAYVAYTATPFANILIDPNDDADIYPRDFIHALPKPKGYFGMEAIFGREPLHGEDEFEYEGLDMIRRVPDDEVSDTRAPYSKTAFEKWAPSVPDSLKDAIRWFILATAARRARGQGNKHSSMLIHTAIRQHAHVLLLEEVQKYVDSITANWEDPTVRQGLEDLWNSEIHRVPAASVNCTTTSFEEVLQHLPSVLDELHCVADNSTSDERLDYENGPQTVIAVGGNTLARGLTLEGLICSYFVRTAAAYDTLIQMGRWFGFRHGYEDLPRIWLTEELENDFRDLALVEADLRQDLARYASEGLTPLDFQACIRTHPDLEVTAKAKQRNSRQVSLSFSGKRVQTILFHHKDAEWLRSNITAANELVSELLKQGVKEVEKSNGTRVFRGVSSSIIEDFLENYTFAPESRIGLNDAQLLKEYIQKEHLTESIRTWNVSFFGVNSHGQSQKFISLGENFNLGLITRTQMMTSGEQANIKSLVGSMDRINDVALTPEATRNLITELTNLEVGHDARIMKIHDDYVGRDVGHLAIYAIDKDSKAKVTPDYVNKNGEEVQIQKRRKDLNAAEHVIGVGIFFPESSNPDSGVQYIAAQPFSDSETIEAIRASEDEVFNTIESESQ